MKIICILIMIFAAYGIFLILKGGLYIIIYQLMKESSLNGDILAYRRFSKCNYKIIKIDKNHILMENISNNNRMLLKYNIKREDNLMTWFITDEKVYHFRKHKL